MFAIEGRADVFDYIERLYKRKRRNGYVGNISPAEFEKRSPEVSYVLGEVQFAVCRDRKKSPPIKFLGPSAADG